jgi:hypothetical protein
MCGQPRWLLFEELSAANSRNPLAKARELEAAMFRKSSGELSGKTIQMKFYRLLEPCQADGWAWCLM